MSTESSPLAGPSMLAILRGAVEAVRASPSILGLFLISGLLVAVLPSFVGVLVRFLLLFIGVVIAYQALGGQMRTNSPFLLRLFMAFLALLASYLLLVVGGLALGVPEYGWIVFLVLFPPGLYIYLRLFLSTPAAMVDGHGPAEALSVSWRLMPGSVLATAFALVFVFVGTILVLLPPLLLVRPTLVVDIGGTLILDTFVAGMQAFLYTELAETP